MFPHEKNKIKRNFSPVYLAIFSGIIIVILIFNGLLEINRTKNGFYRLLEREAIVLIQHFEKNIQETLASLRWVESGQGRHMLSPPLSEFSFGLEASIADYLIETAHRVDQLDQERPLQSSEFQALINQHLIASIEIYDSKGNLLRGWSSPAISVEKKILLRDLIERKRSVVIDLFGKPLTKDHWFAIAIWRKMGPGIIALHLDGEQIKRLFRQFAIQRAISDISLREGILYVSVQDSQFEILAHSDPTFSGGTEEDSFLKSALQRNRPLSRFLQSKKGEESSK